MAIVQDTYTGNGSTTIYSLSFPYLQQSDVVVTLNGTVTTAYTFATANTIQFTTAPGNGVAIKITRNTELEEADATFYPGSTIRAQDLNDNFKQLLYVAQEVDYGTDTANTTANTALTNSNTAISTANTASANASNAVTTANTASANASAAVATANTASTNASNAVTTANSAVTTANAATATANTASTNASNAVSLANAANTNANQANVNASAALSTANTAATNASTALSTANTANTNANTAISDSNSALLAANDAATDAAAAVSTANAAAAAVASAILYTIVANVAAIPASPTNNTAIEVTDSTGIQSFTPLSGIPAGFIGSSGLSVRIVYQSAGSTWVWIQYFPNDPETRYLKFSGGTLTGQLRGDDSTSASTPGFAFDGDANTGMGRPGADELALITGGTARLTIDPSGNVAIGGNLTKGGNNVVTIGDTGTVTSTMIADGTIVNADVNASAAIAGTKISPDFGSQNTTTTGTSTAASFIPSSSTAPTNGVYLPAANSLGISTNSGERLRITSTGLVGVGTSSPAERLDVATTNCTIRSTSTGDATAKLALNSNRAASIINGQILGQWNGNVVSRIDFYNGADGTNKDDGEIAFATANNSSNPIERMRITQAGNVGIGTTSPQTLLHLSSGVGVAAYATFSGNNGSPDPFLIGQDASGLTRLFQTAAQPISFWTDSSERFRIASNGAWGLAGANYGTSGQVLTSNGSASAPTWQAAAGFPAGTAMLFVQTSAPTGWTKSTTHNDKALRVVSGAASSGGSIAFSTAFASRTPAGTIGSTTLTESQIPSHTHSIPTYSSVTSGGSAVFRSTSNSPVGVATGATGGGGSHNHGFTGTAMDFAVQYVDVIIATKD